MKTMTNNSAVTVEIAFQTVDIALDQLVNLDGTPTQYFWELWKDDCNGFAAKRAIKRAGLQPAKENGRWVVNGVQQ